MNDAEILLVLISKFIDCRIDDRVRMEVIINMINDCTVTHIDYKNLMIRCRMNPSYIDEFEVNCYSLTPSLEDKLLYVKKIDPVLQIDWF